MRSKHWIGIVAVTALLFGTAQVSRADAFGAIAYSPSTGNYGYWYGANCLAAAEVGALSGCNAPDRQVVATVENGWAALAVNNNGGWGYGWSTNCLAEAEGYALNGAGGPCCGAHILCQVASGT
jgi:serine/threonine-protein kinase